MAKEIKEVQKEVTAKYTAFTPCNFTHNDKDYCLQQGETYTLPDCDFVQSLIAQGRLETK